MHCNCCCCSSKMLLLFFLRVNCMLYFASMPGCGIQQNKKSSVFQEAPYQQRCDEVETKGSQCDNHTYHLEALISNDCGTQDVASTLTRCTCDTAIFYSPWTWLGSCWDQWITPPRRSSLDQWQSTPANSDTACPCWCAGSPTCRTAPVPFDWSCEGLWSRSATTIVL